MSEGEEPPVSDAKAKAAARQKRLLEKSSERLAKITAKGDGRVISDAAVGIPKRPATEAGPPAPSNLAAALAGDDDPAEVDLAVSQNPLSSPGFGSDDPFAAFGGSGGQNPFAAFGGMGGMGGMGGGGGDGDPFAAMMQQLAGGGGGPGAAGAGGSGFGGLGGAFPQAPTTPFPPTPRSRLDRLFPAVHLLAMASLAVYVVGWMEPARRAGLGVWGTGGASGAGLDWRAWSSLKYKPHGGTWGVVAGYGLAEVPLLWMFVTVELLLQTTRLFLVRNRPVAPGILNTILPVLQQFSPSLALILSTGSRYLELFSVLLNDIAVLVFCIGVAVMWGRWKEGDVGPGLAGVVDGVLEGTLGGAGWNAARTEL